MEFEILVPSNDRGNPRVVELIGVAFISLCLCLIYTSM